MSNKAFYIIRHNLRNDENCHKLFRTTVYIFDIKINVLAGILKGVIEISNVILKYNYHSNTKLSMIN